MKINILFDPKCKKRHAPEQQSFLSAVHTFHYERPIKDLSTGWLVKDGSVEQILVDGKDDEPVMKNNSYVYDKKLVITYHTLEK